MGILNLIDLDLRTKVSSESFIATRLKEFLNQSDVRSYLTT